MLLLFIIVGEMRQLFMSYVGEQIYTYSCI